MPNSQYENLLDYLSELKSVAVAFSGGVDSSFLLFAAKEALGENVVALTANPPYVPDSEIEFAKNFTEKYGIKHVLVEERIIESVKNNPKERCYYCKSNLFSQFKEYQENNGFNVLVDGTNKDDTVAFRPGLKALEELNVLSPLVEVGFTKSKIRECMKSLGLPNWNTPSYSCTLTRFPYNHNITVEAIDRVQMSESYLHSLGYKNIRLRSHGDLARIEVAKGDLAKFMEQALEGDISKKIKSFGFHFVSIDIDGLRSGSFDI